MISCNPIPQLCNYGSSASYKGLPTEEQIANGVIPLDSLPAAWWNCLWFATNSAVNCARSAVGSIIDEINTVLTQAGVCVNPSCVDQLYQSIDKIRQTIGNSSVAGSVKSSTTPGQVSIDSNGIMTANCVGNATQLTTTCHEIVGAINELKSTYDDCFTAVGTCLGDIAAAKAPVSHASSATTYGVGSSTNYGHLKISDTYNSVLSSCSGVAASQKAMACAYACLNSADNTIKSCICCLGATSNLATTCKVVVGAINEVKSAIATCTTAFNNCLTTVNCCLTTANSCLTTLNNCLTSLNSNKAPKAHASTATTYGVGNSSCYGHLKISDTYNSVLSSCSGVAASQKALACAYNCLLAQVPATVTGACCVCISEASCNVNYALLGICFINSPGLYTLCETSLNYRSNGELQAGLYDSVLGMCVTYIPYTCFATTGKTCNGYQYCCAASGNNKSFCIINTCACMAIAGPEFQGFAYNGIVASIDTPHIESWYFIHGKCNGVNGSICLSPVNCDYLGGGILLMYLRS